MKNLFEVKEEEEKKNSSVTTLHRIHLPLSSSPSPPKPEGLSARKEKKCSEDFDNDDDHYNRTNKQELKCGQIGSHGQRHHRCLRRFRRRNIRSGFIIIIIINNNINVCGTASSIIDW